MSGWTAETRPAEGAREAVRWGVSLAAVLGLHVGAVALLLRTVPPFELPPPAPEAVLLDLPAPEPVAEPTPEPVPEPPPQPAAPPEPAPPPPVPQPEPPPPEPPPPEPPPPEPPPPPPPPPPKPVVKPPPPRPPPPRPRPPVPQPVTEAPPIERPVMPQVALPPARPAAASVPVDWQGAMQRKIASAQRYPEQARSRGDQGTVSVTFTVDRQGRVLSARLNRGSGSYLLDEEGVAQVQRASPLPSLPPELPQETLTLTVPIRFTLR